MCTKCGFTLREAFYEATYPVFTYKECPLSDDIFNYYIIELLTVHSKSELLINALRTSFHMNNNGSKPWFSLVGHLMRFVGLDHKTPKASLANGPRRSSKSFRKCLEKAFIEKWNIERQNIKNGQKKSSKLELYASIKYQYGRKNI